MKKRTSIKDVADQAGVSITLVSYVLNNQDEIRRVNKDTAEKVRSVAEKLNYRPNHIAKSLKISKTHTIGLVVASFGYRFTNGIISSIVAEAKHHNYTLLLGSSEENSENFAELVNALINRQVDGLILLAVENSEDQIKYLKEHEIPFVLIDRIFPDIDTNSVLIDNYKSVYKSIEHLIKMGNKKIGFVNYKTSMFHLQERSRGYRQAIEDYKLVSRPEWDQEIRKSNFKEDMDEALKQIIKKPGGCDAVFFATEFLTTNGLKIINRMKVNVPQDLAVMSFDESETYEFFYCPITHGRQPLTKMGKAAVSLLIKAINGKKQSEKILIDSEFVIQKSCRRK